MRRLCMKLHTVCIEDRGRKRGALGPPARWRDVVGLSTPGLFFFRVILRESVVMSSTVIGQLTVEPFKGSAIAVWRTSPVSLFGEDFASFDHAVTYDHADATGFIRLFELPIRTAAVVEKGASTPEAVTRLMEGIAEAGTS